MGRKKTKKEWMDPHKKQRLLENNNGSWGMNKSTLAEPELQSTKGGDSVPVAVSDLETTALPPVTSASSRKLSSLGLFQDSLEFDQRDASILCDSDDSNSSILGLASAF